MDTAALVLLIIVSATLTVFLIVLIVLLVKAVKVIGAVSRLASKAENLVSSAEEATELLKKSAGPIALGRFIANMAEAVTKHRKK